jgi:hypothetical protein
VPHQRPSGTAVVEDPVEDDVPALPEVVDIADHPLQTAGENPKEDDHQPDG